MNLFARKSVLLVLGMHRSGTSALTRVLSLCGASLPRTLFDAVEGDNDLGYWESRPIIEYHEALFSRIGTTMLAGEPIDPAWFDSEDARVAERDLVRIVRAEWGGGWLAPSRCWIIKEPRICRLMPLWRRVLAGTGRQIAALHAIREPAEVAASLARRDGFAREAAERAWLEHVVLAERATRDLPRAFVSYDMLMADWQTVVARAMKILPHGAIDEGRGAADIAAFLRPSLRHHTVVAECESESVLKIRNAAMDAARWGLEPDLEAFDEAAVVVLNSNDTQRNAQRSFRRA